MTARDGRLGIGVIGAGRVGAVLGAALGGAGHAVVGVSAVSAESRERAEVLLPGVPVLEVSEVARRAELVIVAVPEDQLAPLVDGLAATEAWQPGQLVLHTAARFGTGVLAPAAGRGAIPLAVHPALAFTGTSIDLVRMRDARCAVTAPTPVLPIAQALAIEMGAEPVVIAERDREAYADAIETARGYSVAIVEQSRARLAGIGMDDPAALLAPLIRSAVDAALG